MIHCCTNPHGTLPGQHDILRNLPGTCAHSALSALCLCRDGHQAAASGEYQHRCSSKAGARALSLHVHSKFYTREGDLLSRCIGQPHLWPAAAHRLPVACMEDLLVIQAAART